MDRALLRNQYCGGPKNGQIFAMSFPAPSTSLSAIPALKLFRGGEVVETAVGYQNKESLEELLKNI